MHSGIHLEASPCLVKKNLSDRGCELLGQERRSIRAEEVTFSIEMDTWWVTAIYQDRRPAEWHQERIPKHMMRPGDEIRNDSHTVEQNHVIVWLSDSLAWSWKLRRVGGTEYPGEMTTFWRTKNGKRKVKRIGVHDVRWHSTFCGWSAS